MGTGEGLEPPWAVTPADLETAAIAAMRTGIRMVLPPGIELGIHDYKSSVIPFNYRSKPAIVSGSPAWARSTDLLINSQTLLPTELLGNSN